MIGPIDRLHEASFTLVVDVRLSEIARVLPLSATMSTGSRFFDVYWYNLDRAKRIFWRWVELRGIDVTDALVPHITGRFHLIPQN